VEEKTERGRDKGRVGRRRDSNRRVVGAISAVGSGALGSCEGAGQVVVEVGAGARRGAGGGRHAGSGGGARRGSVLVEDAPVHACGWEEQAGEREMKGRNEVAVGNAPTVPSE